MTAPLDDLPEAPASAHRGAVPRDRDEPAMFLERAQLVSDRRIAVPPARLSGRAQAGLWMLRTFALVVGFMVIYTFVAQLH